MKYYVRELPQNKYRYRKNLILPAEMKPGDTLDGYYIDRIEYGKDINVYMTKSKNE